MELKKIYPPLKQALEALDLVQPTTLQFETWSALKSGADCVLVSPEGSGKSTAIAMAVIQKLQKAEGESTRALIIVNDKEQVLETVGRLKQFAAHTDLRIFGVHERGDIDYDKNHISLGLDILVGTPTKINSLFSSAGFNLNTVRFMGIDDADVVFKNRQDSIILRLHASIERTQLVFTAAEASERFEIMVDKTMEEPIYFDFSDEES